MPADEVVQTGFGKFLVNSTDIIESTLKAGTVWDGPGFLQVIAAQYTDILDHRPTSTIIDVGANVGAFTIWLTSLYAGRVVAVEPIPQTYARLVANLDLNKSLCAQRVITIPYAAYVRDTHLRLAKPLDPSNLGGATLLPASGVPEPQDIPAVALDKYHLLYGDKVSLIKIDAEGCDVPALGGLTQTIHKHHPAIVFEWDRDAAARHNVTWNDVQQFLSAHRYEWVTWPSHPDNIFARPT